MPSVQTCVAVAYMRVSRGDEHGHDHGLGHGHDTDTSLQSQRAAIEAWGVRRGVALASWKSDEGISGSTPIAERPGLVAAYLALREVGAGVLVAAHRHTFASDAFVAGLVEQAARARGAMLVTADADSGDEYVSAEAELQESWPVASEGGEQAWTRGAIDLFVAYQRAVIRARTREALSMKRARGERLGAVPYGYSLATDGLHLEADAAEQAVLLRVRELSSAGLSQREIVERLGAQGIVGRTGAPLQKTQVARILLRVAA